MLHGPVLDTSDAYFVASSFVEGYLTLRDSVY